MKVTYLTGTKAVLSRRGEIHLRRRRQVDRDRRLSRESLAGSVPTDYFSVYSVYSVVEKHL